MASIEVSHVTKEYRLEQLTSLKPSAWTTSPSVRGPSLELFFCGSGFSRERRALVPDPNGAFLR
ncbi:MAG: hypothetical protein HYX63_01000 [Gammaproteobacteria bacterium]|nr:hypothetical protein [Gammaproteobacteria bacterium]